MNPTHLSGKCFCGAVEYKLVGGVSEAFFCHCESCRRSSGAPFVAWGRIKITKFEFTKGEISTFKSSPRVHRSFCTKCGTEVAYKHDDYQAEVDIRLGTLNDPDEVVPDHHVWIAEKLSWIHIRDDLPKYQKRRPEGGGI